MYAIRFSRILISFLAVCLVFLLAASASQSDARASSSNTSHALKPALSTTCPANGTARPAVMMPLALGSHRNIVYVYNEIPPHTTISYGHIKRYDVTTGQKTILDHKGGTYFCIRPLRVKLEYTSSRGRKAQAASGPKWLVL